MIDTGASINLIVRETFERFKTKTSVKQTADEILRVRSECATITIINAEIESKRKITTTDAYVAAGESGSLLSSETATELDLIGVNVNTVRPTGSEFAWTTIA